MRRKRRIDMKRNKMNAGIYRDLRVAAVVEQASAGRSIE